MSQVLENTEDFSKITILGPKRIEVAGAVYDIYELMREILKKDTSIIGFKTVKMQLHIRERVKPEHLLLWLARFFDHKVEQLSFNSYSWYNPIERTHKESTGFGNIKWTSEETISNRKHAIIALVKEKKPNFENVYRYLINVRLKPSWGSEKQTAFDDIKSVVLSPTRQGDHVVSFGCEGDCQPQLQTASAEDFEDFVTFFKARGYKIRASICGTRIRRIRIQEYKTKKNEFGEDEFKDEEEEACSL